MCQIFALMLILVQLELEMELELETSQLKSWAMFRSSRSEVFCEKDVLRNFAKFTEVHLCQSVFFNKIAGLIACKFVKKETLAQVASCEFCEIWLLLYVTSHVVTFKLYFEQNVRVVSKLICNALYYNSRLLWTIFLINAKSTNNYERG